MRKLSTVIGLVLIVALGLVATVGRPQPARAADGDNVVLQWDEVTLQAIRDTRPLPTVAARALAVVHTVIYDAWAAYDPVAVGTGNPRGKLDRIPRDKNLPSRRNRRPGGQPGGSILPGI